MASNKYKVKLSINARNELDSIFAYIANTLDSPTTAAELSLKIYDTILSLDEMPNRFPRITEEIPTSEEYRKAIVKNYVILYLINEDNKIVNIAHVFHGSMNYIKYI